MKKTVAVLLAMALAMGIVACGSDGAAANTANETTQAAEAAADTAQTDEAAEATEAEAAEPEAAEPEEVDVAALPGVTANNIGSTIFMNIPEIGDFWSMAGEMKDPSLTQWESVEDSNDFYVYAEDMEGHKALDNMISIVSSYDSAAAAAADKYAIYDSFLEQEYSEAEIGGLPGYRVVKKVWEQGFYEDIYLVDVDEVPICFMVMYKDTAVIDSFVNDFLSNVTIIKK